MPMTTTSPDVRTLIQNDLPSIVAIRRDFHQHPELSYQEQRTSRVVVRELAAAGVEVKAGMAGGTGVLGYLPATVSGRENAPSVALRADMDALPITETTGKPYASTTKGVMHACGHDGHTAMLIGAAKALAKVEQRPNPVTFVFQPAEEGGAGGERLCDEGCLLGESGGGLGAKVGRIFGLHGWPGVPVGSVATRPGPLLAATDDFNVTIRGVGGHAAYPHAARDPIVAASAVVNALQSISSRSVSPVDSVICTVGAFNAGFANNVIPETANLVGTVRTLRAETRALARQRFFEITESIARAHGAVAEITWHEGYPVTRNDEQATEHFFNVAKRTLGDERVAVHPEPGMGGEDFSYYGQHVPACFFLLGLLAEGDDPMGVPQLHQSGFDFNDDAIPTGIE
ncbi:MAG: amidohydrolase, partial [Planctomycetota bacterium]